MTLSPKKKYISTFTSSTNNIGVEAKEIEIINTQLGYAMNATNSTGAHYQVESSSGSLVEQLQRGLEMESASQITSLPATDEASFIQVIVQKHRKKRSAEAPGSPRLPHASSPLAKGDAAVKGKQQSRASGDAGPRELYVLPHPMLLSYPAPRGQRLRYSWARAPASFRRLVRATRPPRPAPRPKPVPAPAPAPSSLPEMRKESFWKRITKISEDDLDLLDDGPERVEVYYFEREGCDRLRTTDGAPAAAAERLARRAERLVARACAEVLALPQFLVALPVTVALMLLRAACVAVRGAAVGGVTVLADYLVKPALAAAFNALVRPPLVLLHNTARALREAVGPLAGVLADALAPVARLVRPGEPV